jgi:hypothetical protein
VTGVRKVIPEGNNISTPKCTIAFLLVSIIILLPVTAYAQGSTHREELHIATPAEYITSKTSTGSLITPIDIPKTASPRTVAMPFAAYAVATDKIITLSEYDGIQIGMTRAEVVSIAGEPYEISVSENEIQYNGNPESADAIDKAIIAFDTNNAVKSKEVVYAFYDYTDGIFTYSGKSKKLNVPKYYREKTPGDNSPYLMKALNVEGVYEGSSSVTSLDLSKCTELEILYCPGLGLSKLDLSTNTKLEILSCSNNKLTSLNTSTLTKLKELFCYNNRLKELELTNNKDLARVDCRENKLTILKVSNLPKLKRLWCQDNKLKNLVLTNDKALISVECHKGYWKYNA